jgi:hypothetical protein
MDWKDSEKAFVPSTKFAWNWFRVAPIQFEDLPLVAIPDEKRGVPKDAPSWVFVPLFREAPYRAIFASRMRSMVFPVSSRWALV